MNFLEQFYFLDGSVVYQVTESIADFSYVDEIQPSLFDLVFKADNIPPLGLKLYYIDASKTESNEIPNSKSESTGKADEGSSVHIGTNVSITGFTLNTNYAIKLTRKIVCIYLSDR